MTQLTTFLIISHRYACALSLPTLFFKKMITKYKQSKELYEKYTKRWESPNFSKELAETCMMQVTMEMASLLEEIRLMREVLIQKYSTSKFEVTSGKIIISDPCYDKHGTYGNSKDSLGEICDAENGTWIAETELSDEGDWGIRVKALHCYLQDSKNFTNTGQVNCNNLAVDSGQMSVVDYEKYKPESLEHHDNAADEWYSKVCDTHGGFDIGIFDGGCVCSSGYGDGGYDGVIIYNEFDKAIDIKILFI